MASQAAGPPPATNSTSSAAVAVPPPPPTAAAHHTPQTERPTIQLVLAPGSHSPPTPTDYEIMTESCDWCMAETPWEAAPELFGSSSSSGGSHDNEDSLIEDDDKGVTATPTTTQTSPPTHHDDGIPNVNLRPRQFLNIPMM